MERHDEPVHLPALIADTFGGSRSDARRCIAMGGVKIDDKPVPPDALDWKRSELAGHTLKLGKRREAVL